LSYICVQKCLQVLKGERSESSVDEGSLRHTITEG
jgi:hypothetical protein